MKRKFHGNRFTNLKALKVEDDLDMSTRSSDSGEKDETKSASFLKLGESVGLDLDLENSVSKGSDTASHDEMDSEGYRLFQKLQIISFTRSFACPVCLCTYT